MRGIEALVILAVASLCLAVVPGGEWSDLFILNPVPFQLLLEQGQVVCLYTLNRHREGLEQVFREKGRCVGAMFVKSFYEALPGMMFDDGAERFVECL